MTNVLKHPFEVLDAVVDSLPQGDTLIMFTGQGFLEVAEKISGSRQSEGHTSETLFWVGLMDINISFKRSRR